MNNVHSKPRLVFFQYQYDKHLPEFLLLHFREHVKCLEESFDVTIINEDCDYQQICERYQPDVTLFESGPNILTNAVRRPKITNVRACLNIPKLGLINADAWCETRAGVLSEMDHLNIDTFFSISTTAAEHTPQIADNLFIWPVFVDAEIFKDYGESKLIPVLLTGAIASQYPWRNRMYKLLSRRYPSLSCPHHGYLARSAVGQVIFGTQYARTINASLCVPACGTIAKEVVRKHFEIPACRACLITERSPGLETAGFIDMQNCVFGDEHDILDKLDYLFGNPDQLEKITNAGHQLVHTHHTLKHRDQILQWVRLHESLKPNERIVQRGPFEALTVVDQSSGIRSSHIAGEGLHLMLVRQGDKKLWAGKYEEAEGLYLRCLNFTRSLPEARFRLALCNLYRGDPRAAARWVLGLIHYTLSDYKAVDPDPVEWAWLILSLLCLGKTNEAIKRSRQFEWLSHPELDRARFVVSLLTNAKAGAVSPNDGVQGNRASIHQMPGRTFDEWFEQLCIILRACRQCALLERLMNSILKEDAVVRFEQGRSVLDYETLAKSQNSIDDVARKSSLVLRKKFISRYVGRPLFYFGLRKKLGSLGQQIADRFSGILHSLETKHGYFLPYRFSAKRNDEFFRVVQELAQKEDISAGLMIGACVGDGATEAFLAGIAQNKNTPPVFCINRPTRRFARLEKMLTNKALVKCYRTSPASPEEFPAEIAKSIKKIKREHEITSFDAVLMNGSTLKQTSTFTSELRNELNRARLVILDNITTLSNYEHNNQLLNDPNYVLAHYNPALRNGYAIFRREAHPCSGNTPSLLEAKDDLQSLVAELEP